MRKTIDKAKLEQELERSKSNAEYYLKTLIGALQTRLDNIRNKKETWATYSRVVDIENIQHFDKSIYKIQLLKQLLKDGE